MDRYRQINDLVKGFYKPGQVFFTAELVSVEGTTCTIKVDDLILNDIRLKPTTTPTKDQVLLVPKAGTNVLVGSFSGDYNNLFVLNADEVDKIDISCNGQNLMTSISELIQTLSNATVITGKSIGVFEPSVKAQLNHVETAFKQIFK